MTNPKLPPIAPPARTDLDEAAMHRIFVEGLQPVDDAPMLDHVAYLLALLRFAPKGEEKQSGVLVLALLSMEHELDPDAVMQAASAVYETMGVRLVGALAERGIPATDPKLN
jgi:hypothetical protein